jgi:hypothetical protein
VAEVSAQDVFDRDESHRCMPMAKSDIAIAPDYVAVSISTLADGMRGKPTAKFSIGGTNGREEINGSLAECQKFGSPLDSKRVGHAIDIHAHVLAPAHTWASRCVLRITSITIARIFVGDQASLLAHCVQ